MVANFLAIQRTNLEILGTKLQKVVIRAQIVDAIYDKLRIIESLSGVDIITGRIGLVALAVERIEDDVAVGNENLAGVLTVIAVIQFLDGVKFNRKDTLER